MVAVASSARRQELGAFLRSRRERISPEEHGLAPGQRRRTPGLRREELAQLAGVGVTWYTWLEQGREINASVQVLDAIAAVLRLGPAERWHVYRLAEVPGVPVAPSADVLPSEALRVLDALDPSPACIFDGMFDLLACNETYTALFPRMVEANGVERNALWQTYVNVVGSPVIDREVCESMVRTMRANYINHLDDPRWTGFAEDLRAASPEFRALWDENEVGGPPPPVTKAFECFGLGVVRVRTMGFPVSNTREQRMVVYLPESAADVALLAKLRERIRTDRSA